MRIMLVTYRYGRNIAGGGERYLRELMIRLARKGHQVDVYTTRSQRMIQTPFGYLVWDNFMPPGRQEDEGVGIHRYEVRNPRPRRARSVMADIREMHERERESPIFAALLAQALEGRDEHCFLSGWHERELWEDGPARWTRKSARLVAGGEAMTSLELDAYSYLDGHLLVEIPGKGSWEFELEKGRPRKLRMDFAPSGSAAVNLVVPRAVRPMEDMREVGIAVRRVVVTEDGRERSLELDRGWKEFLDTAPEVVVGEVLWGMSESRPRRYARRHHYVMGPRSPHLEKQALTAARDYDLVFGSMAPMSTLDLAWRAARHAGKPFVAFPLFHTRDPNHYWAHFKDALEGAGGVEANSRVIEELMCGWGFNAFAVGPGYGLEEFSAPDIDGEAFRREFGFTGRPVLLWVGRKNVYKGYREAMAVLQSVRGKGCPAVLAMIGPDEDNLPVGGEGIYYLGALPRKKLLDAFDACDVFLFPSLHESFCLVFGEAWLRGRPVLGNAYCAAARGLIEHGMDGYLCTDIEDYGSRVLELINDPALARRMGERGKEKVLRTRGWDPLVDELESKLEQITTASKPEVPNSLRSEA
ncbi:MAG: glycosyltransferase [Actinobacteria bacterium]|nr:glycosyltransferase [Actinomycetota bacterium]